MKFSRTGRKNTQPGLPLKKKQGGLGVGQLAGILCLGKEYRPWPPHPWHKKGDLVSILSENRLEWLYADMGTLGLGGVVVPIYTTLLTEEVGYVLKNSGAKAIFVENRSQLDKVLACQKELPKLEKIIVMDPGEYGEENNNKIMGFKTIYELGRQKQKESSPPSF